MISVNLKSLGIILMITLIFLTNKSVSFSQESIENALVVRVNPEYLDLNKKCISGYRFFMSIYMCIFLEHINIAWIIT